MVVIETLFSMVDWIFYQKLLSSVAQLQSTGLLATTLGNHDFEAVTQTIHLHNPKTSLYLPR